MLAEKEPVFSDIDERKWAKVTRYEEISLTESLKSFELQRDHLLRVLLTLLFESWESFAMIAGRKHTVFTQVRRMAKHEQEHIKQIHALLQ